MRALLIVVLATLGGAHAAGGVAPPDLLGGGKLVVYTPLGWTADSAWRPSAGALRADAADLARIGFHAIVTDRAAPASKAICRFFKRHGFASVIVGVADPTDAAELRTARTLRRCADGYAVGSGGLATGRYHRAALEAAATGLRRATGRPVAIRELVASYRADPRLLGVGDWVFPIVPADLSPGTQVACGETAAAYRELLERGPQDRPVALASAGVPTAGIPAASEHAQRAFFLCLASRGVPFAYDEAYDQPWRAGAAGARGLFRADGTPKLFAWQVARPRITIAHTEPALAGRVEAATPSRFAVVVYDRPDGHWRPAATAPLSRGGRWRIGGAVSPAAVVVLAARASPPPGATDRPPQVDGVSVFATAP
jgi:hypothetical protein